LVPCGSQTPSLDASEATWPFSDCRDGTGGNKGPPGTSPAQWNHYDGD